MADQELLRAARLLARRVEALRFSSPVSHVYNPLRYAHEPHESYLSRFANGPCRVVFVGMNPGPWGMAQTGVPFGEVAVVRDWLSVSGAVDAPRDSHPRVPVRGFACTRSEVSGRRLWGLLRKRYGTPEALARDAFVANYCPLLFLDAAGSNLTPERLARDDRAALFPPCDAFLSVLFERLRPRWVIGVGRFAYQRAGAVLGAGAVSRVLLIRHPSPANPRAN